MLDEWAFARVELNLGDAEFFALSPRQWSALLEQWKQKEQRRLAVHMTCALNARWGSKTNIAPFSVGDFLPVEPKSEEEQRAEDERLLKAKNTIFTSFYKELVQDLPPITQPKPKKRRGRKSK